MEVMYLCSSPHSLTMLPAWGPDPHPLPSLLTYSTERSQPHTTMNTLILQTMTEPHSLIYPNLIIQKSRCDLLGEIPWGRGAQESWLILSDSLRKALSFPMCRSLSRKGRRPAWMNKTLLMIELNRKNEVHRGWRQGQATHEEYRDVA